MLPLHLQVPLKVNKSSSNDGFTKAENLGMVGPDEGPQFRPHEALVHDACVAILAVSCSVSPSFGRRLNRETDKQTNSGIDKQVPENALQSYTRIDP